MDNIYFYFEEGSGFWYQPLILPDTTSGMDPSCCREPKPPHCSPLAWEQGGSEQLWDAGLEGHSRPDTPTGETPKLHNIPLTLNKTTKSFNKSITQFRVPNNKITATIYFQWITFLSKGLEVNSFLLFFFYIMPFEGFTMQLATFASQRTCRHLIVQPSVIDSWLSWALNGTR